MQIALICLIVVICSVNGMDDEGRGDKSAKGIFQSWKDKHGKHCEVGIGKQTSKTNMVNRQSLPYG